MNVNFNIKTLIGEATAYDKKRGLEKKKPKSWLKSVSAFANGEGGMLIFGISDDDEIVGIADVKKDSEDISEIIKTMLDPIPEVNLSFPQVNGKDLILLQVYAGQETPYYYIGDKQRTAFIRIGNESVVADRIQLKSLVLKGAGRTYDSLPSSYKFEDMSFTRLKSIHYKRLKRSFEDSEFVSWGIVDENGKLTNAGALLADDSPMRQSQIFCTRWNGLTMTSGLGEAIDDVELQGCVIAQLQDAVAFIRNNSKKKWWKEGDHREELPDYPERAVTETVSNSLIHRDYLQMGSEVHIDMYDDRIEVYSPGGMFDGSLIQNLDPLTVPSKRRNPLLADFFTRLNLMERRGSGMRKIIEAYKQYEKFTNCPLPSFRSKPGEFHVTLWNQNYGKENVVKEFTKEEDFTKELSGTEKEFLKEFSGTNQQFLKEDLQFRKEFLKAQRSIYKMITAKANTTILEMSQSMGISDRQVRKYIKRLTDLNLIERVGGRKTGEWRIIDKEYDIFD